MRRLVLMVMAATIARAIVTAAAYLRKLNATAARLRRSPLSPCGLVGRLDRRREALAVMTWQTLKIPNTQSATGILYVAVIGVFIGELTSQLLSAHASFPL